MNATRFNNGVADNVRGSARILFIFDKDFASDKRSIKECILQAMPSFTQKLADDIELMVTDLIAHEVRAKKFILMYGLTSLEASAICWWTADVASISSLSSQESPYFAFNTALRKRDAPAIRLWRDFAYFLINALQKLPPVETTTFRGESKRVTELSEQYVRGNQVRTGSDPLRLTL